MPERDDLEAVADALADALGIEPESVQIEPTTNRLSISVKQAQRIVRALNKEN